MTVSLEKGEAVITPKPGRSFDPTGIPKAVKNAGFTPGEVRFAVRGKLARYERFLALDVPGHQEVIVVEGGPRIDELRGKRELLGQTIVISGRLHVSHGDKPPGMTVENFSKSPPPAR